MRFSLYSEIQQHPGKTPQQLYAEVLEQVVNADRLGYDVYSVIEHFFFPKFSISANPTALLRRRCAAHAGTFASGRCCTRFPTTTRWSWRLRSR